MSFYVQPLFDKYMSLSKESKIMHAFAPLPCRFCKRAIEKKSIFRTQVKIGEFLSRSIGHVFAAVSPVWKKSVHPNDPK
ncbi:hypothetical protein POVWA2_037010 [Plasmodium ovale wallikeri]|uniref:Uncharacterized protein n=1 Tax=Plasmodium ovale wallikeri TaxID=864142 RepID=A0A1A8Z5E5_PLAOA|nr:hypothetical protein POVWA2_037010 [Plasmodium ovale wallikeri]